MPLLLVALHLLHVVTLMVHVFVLFHLRLYAAPGLTKYSVEDMNDFVNLLSDFINLRFEEEDGGRFLLEDYSFLQGRIAPIHSNHLTKVFGTSRSCIQIDIGGPSPAVSVIYIFPHS